MAGILFVISAPSGTGKTTVIKAVREQVEGLGYSVSHTTRPPRRNERNGVDYHFVSKEEFTRMIQEGAFVEWAQIYGEYYGTAYETLEMEVGAERDVILDLDPQGGKNIKSRYGDDSVLIYLLPPDLESLDKRLKTRGTDSGEVIRDRLSSAFQQIKECLTYDYIIFNETLEAAVDNVCSIVAAERSRAKRMAHLVRERFNI